jgi:uncharacterized protein (TIGR03083 family)
VPDHSPEETIAALEEVWSATAQMLGELQPDAWDRPTDCPGWSVRDHVSHLIGTELGLLGTTAPPPPDPMPEHVHNPIGASNEAWVDPRRDRPGTEVLAEFVDVTARRLDELKAMPTERWAELGWSPVGEAPYAEFMQIRVMDCWVHEQDIRWAVDRPGDRGGRGEQVALNRLTASLGFVIGRRVAPSEGTTVAVDLTGPTPRHLALAMQQGRANVINEIPTEPSVAITMPAEHFVRLACGRETVDDVLASGEATIAGNEELGNAIISSMNIMI